MGLAALWSHLTSPRVKGIIPPTPYSKNHRPFSFELLDAETIPNARVEVNMVTAAAARTEMVITGPPDVTVLKKDRRHSHGMSISRSEHPLRAQQSDADSHLATNNTAEIIARLEAKDIYATDALSQRKTQRRISGLSLSHQRLERPLQQTVIYSAVAHRNIDAAKKTATEINPKSERLDENKTIRRPSHGFSPSRHQVESRVERTNADAGSVPDQRTEIPATPSVGVLSEQKDRRSRGSTLSSYKNDDTSRKRKRFFSRSTNVDANVPAVSVSPPLTQQRSRPKKMPDEGILRPRTATMVCEPIKFVIPNRTPTTTDVRKSKPISLARVMSRKRSQSTSSQYGMKKRQLLLFGVGRGTDANAPTLPPTPVSVPLSTELEIVQLPTSGETRKSRRIALGQALTGSWTRRIPDASQTKKKKQSSFQSSNSNHKNTEPSAASPAPALIHDGAETPESMGPNADTPNPGNLIDYTLFNDSPERTAIRGDDIKQPRPVSMQSRCSYRPKRAASGFLKPTSPSTDDLQPSTRKASMRDGEDGMICLNDEQLREWNKLKQLME